jgi:hypothetical protein
MISVIKVMISVMKVMRVMQVISVKKVTENGDEMKTLALVEAEFCEETNSKEPLNE